MPLGNSIMEHEMMLISEDSKRKTILNSFFQPLMLTEEPSEE